MIIVLPATFNNPLEYIQAHMALTVRRCQDLMDRGRFTDTQATTKNMGIKLCLQELIT